MSKKNEYAPSKIRPIIQLVARMVQKDPSLADDKDRLWATIATNVPELRDRSNCANCGGSMVIYRYTITKLDADLLCAMAKIIGTRMRRGMAFTEANKIHLQSSEISDYTLLSRQTIASKLGLVAKVMKKTPDGKDMHDTKAGWSVTRRGFDFLKGKPVVKSVPVFHNRIVEGEREEMITMAEVYRNHPMNSDWAEVAGVFIEGYEVPRLF